MTRTQTRSWTVLSAGLFLALTATAASAQDDGEYVAIHVGKLIVGNGETMDDVTILTLDGKVEAVGKKVELPFPCEEIDARDQVAMPGLIHPMSRRGLQTFNRSGVQAHRRVADEFLPDDDSFEGALEAGFTTLILAPPGQAAFGGRAMAVRTAETDAGWILDEESYVAMAMGARPPGNKTAIRKAFDDAKKEIEKVEKARKEWEEKQKKAAEEAKKKAEEEAKKKEAEKNGSDSKEPPKNGGKAADDPKPESKDGEKKDDKPAEFVAPEIRAPLRPLVSMIEGKDDVFGLVMLGGASTYLHLKDTLRGYDVPYVLAVSLGGGGGFFGSPDLNFAAEHIGENEETILVTPSITNYPSSINRISIPRQLHDAGATVGFMPSGDDDRSLDAFRYQVAELVKAGYPRDEALQAMTLRLATALGMGDRLGSIEEGKDANLILLSADPFDVQARVTHVVLEGSVVYDHDDD